jgi:hypothetical protein
MPQWSPDVRSWRDTVAKVENRTTPKISRQPGIVAQRPKFATEMMRANAGFHPDQARWHVGKAGLDLATRPFLTQRNGTTLIVVYDVERVLADIDTNHGKCSDQCLGHGVLLVLMPLPSFYCWRGGSTTGPSH